MLYSAWLRRRLRCYRLKQRKRRYSIATWLQQQGVTEHNTWKLAMSDKGWWHLALNVEGESCNANKLIRGVGFDESLKNVCDSRLYGGVRGREASSYSIVMFTLESLKL